MDEDLRKFQRLLRLLHYLSNPGGMTVQRMADKTGVDVRTIYRDLDELRDACFDIVQSRPRGPYSLSGEYTALGQTLSLEEVLCLGLSSCLLQQQLGGIGREAMRKLQHFIKGEKRELARDLPQVVQARDGEDHQWVPPLVTAVSQRRRVRFEYSKGDEPTRTLDPYTVFYQDERWYVQGFDHLRKDLRRFRLARIISLEVLQQSFMVPKTYDSKSALFHKWDIAVGEPVAVLCRVDPALAEWLKENPQHPTQSVDQNLFRLTVRDLDALGHWLLSLRGVEVLEPEQLRVWMREKAMAIAAAHSS